MTTVIRPVPVLLYHSVSTDSSGLIGRYTTTPEVFRSHVAWVAEQGFQTLTVSDYVRARAGGTVSDRPPLVTFDDGFADFVDEALPVLTEHDVRATLYVTTRPVGRSQRGTLAGRPMLTWSELHKVRAAGIELGGHSHDHVQLDVVPRRDALHQVTTCRQLLQDNLQIPIASFAYPHGYNSARTRSAVRAAGYSSACGVGNALTHERDDVWALARVMLEHDDRLDRVQSLCRRDTDVVTFAPRLQSLRTRAWRVARRARRTLHPQMLAPPTVPRDLTGGSYPRRHVRRPDRRWRHGRDCLRGQKSGSRLRGGLLGREW